LRGSDRLKLALHVGDVVGCDGDQFPSVVAGVHEQVDVVGLARHVVEVDLAVIPLRHLFLLERASRCGGHLLLIGAAVAALVGGPTGDSPSAPVALF
jgi:hypothetical protein